MRSSFSVQTWQRTSHDADVSLHCGTWKNLSLWEKWARLKGDFKTCGIERELESRNKKKRQYTWMYDISHVKSVLKSQCLFLVPAVTSIAKEFVHFSQMCLHTTVLFGGFFHFLEKIKPSHWDSQSSRSSLSGKMNTFDSVNLTKWSNEQTNYSKQTAHIWSEGLMNTKPLHLLESITNRNEEQKFKDKS